MKRDQDRQTSIDRMRYIKNKFSANMALLAILFDVFYFVSIYKTDVGSYYYTIMIGASIIYNLVFLLAAFLSSEGVKMYDEKFCYLMIFLGIMQFVRIFVIPLRAVNATVVISKVEVATMTSGHFLRCVIYLAVSGICCLLGAGVGIVRSRTLKAYMATLGEEVRRD